MAGGYPLAPFQDTGARHCVADGLFIAISNVLYKRTDAQSVIFWRITPLKRLKAVSCYPTEGHPPAMGRAVCCSYNSIPHQRFQNLSVLVGQKIFFRKTPSPL